MKGGWANPSRSICGMLKGRSNTGSVAEGEGEGSGESSSRDMSLGQ